MIPEPPRKWARLAWLGPGFLWMVSAAGSGELLFTPRVGSLHGYAFLILGAELLRPRGLVPEEQRVAATLGRLLGDVWGPAAYWFMVLGVFIGFWDTVLSDQDGHGRMFADGSRLIVRPLRRYSEPALRRGVVLVLVTALPIGLYLGTGEPVQLLKIAGAIEASHIPVVTGLTRYLNRTVPAALRPSWPIMAATAVAGSFFAAFAVYYLLQLGSGSR